MKKGKENAISPWKRAVESRYSYIKFQSCQRIINIAHVRTCAVAILLSMIFELSSVISCANRWDIKIKLHTYHNNSVRNGLTLIDKKFVVGRSSSTLCYIQIQTIWNYESSIMMIIIICFKITLITLTFDVTFFFVIDTLNLSHKFDRE